MTTTVAPTSMALIPIHRTSAYAKTSANAAVSFHLAA